MSDQQKKDRFFDSFCFNVSGPVTKNTPPDKLIYFCSSCNRGASTRAVVAFASDKKTPGS